MIPFFIARSGFRRLFKFTILSSVLTLSLACSGTIARQTAGGSAPTTSDNADTATSRAYVFATDYQSSGQLYQVTATDDETALSNTGLSYLGSSAIIRVYEGFVIVLHDGFSTVSTDNLQIVDPADNYATLGQYSTGNGTNPHDVVITGSRAFITLYNPKADDDNVDSAGRPGDVIEMDIATGEIVRRFSFQDHLADDGDLNANAEQMALSGDFLYVALQDLDGNTFAANSNGLIGIIDIASNAIVDVITLAGRNPVSLAISSDGATLAVANMATYDFTLGNFDTDAAYGGLEIVDLDVRQSLGLIDDADLGGFVERVETDGTTWYAVVSEFDGASFSYSSQIVSAPQNAVSANDFGVIDDSGTDIREIAIDAGVLWISRRQINTQTGLSEPVLEAVDLATGESIGDLLVPAAPGMSMVGF